MAHFIQSMENRIFTIKQRRRRTYAVAKNITSEPQHDCSSCIVIISSSQHHGCVLIDRLITSYQMRKQFCLFLVNDKAIFMILFLIYSFILLLICCLSSWSPFVLVHVRDVLYLRYTRQGSRHCFFLLSILCES